MRDLKVFEGFEMIERDLKRFKGILRKIFRDFKGF